jgi:hypothetical protein
MRPLGVTLLGTYQILRGALGILVALAVMFFSGLAARLSFLAAEGNAAGRMLQGIGRAAGLATLIFALVHILAGYGLLKMERWGRLLTLLFSAIGLVILLPVLVVAHGMPLMFGLINAASVFYLAMPQVKRAFLSEHLPLRAAA